MKFLLDCVNYYLGLTLLEWIHSVKIEAFFSMDTHACIQGSR